MTDLNKFLADITSIYWWIAVVLVGMAINLISAYLKPALDRFYAARSDRSRRKSEQERAEVEVEAGVLHKSTRLLILKGFEEVRWFVLSIFVLVFALGLAGLGTYLVTTSRSGLPPLLASILFVSAFAATVLSLWAFGKAADAVTVLLATRRIEMDEMLRRGEAISPANDSAKDPHDAA